MGISRYFESYSFLGKTSKMVGKIGSSLYVLDNLEREKWKAFNVEEVNSLVAELANASAKERACLDQCRDLLSTLAAMQVRMVSIALSAYPKEACRASHIPVEMVTHIGMGSGLGPSAGRVNSYWESITKTGLRSESGKEAAVGSTADAARRMTANLMGGCRGLGLMPWIPLPTEEDFMEEADVLPTICCFARVPPHPPSSSPFSSSPPLCESQFPSPLHCISSLFLFWLTIPMMI
ncbi:hypothetical protein CK203_117392 [Vitis vinifera]|uniref:Uncharacterized protein n=1 Tax=Vitis vinifera TaxID=29760 RepID=A0A438FCI1_VITVI|nr:hypothetical protein CK203_117392 [Vitis vinifera]